MNARIRELKPRDMVLPAMSDIPGLSYRSFRGQKDYPCILSVITSSKKMDGIERSLTLDDIEHVYTHLVNSDPFKDMVFVEVDGEVVGYAHVRWRQVLNGPCIFLLGGFVHGQWRRKGIGRALLHWNETCARQIAADLPNNSERFFATEAADTELGAHPLFHLEGYKPERYFFDMIRDLSKPISALPLPVGVEVRPASKEHFRSIWDADQEAFKDHWSHIPGTEEDYQSFISHKTTVPSRWKVAWAGDIVAGMVLNFVDEDENAEYTRKRGYTENICVRRPWRRMGLARALLTQSLQMFQEQGYAEAALEVDAQNRSGALGLYESVGFRVVKEFITYRKPM